MKTLIRRHPIDIYLLTGEEAREAREVAFGIDCVELNSKPCFVTNSFGHDGFAWYTPEQFEDDWTTTFGHDDTGIHSRSILMMKKVIELKQTNCDEGEEQYEVVRLKNSVSYNVGELLSKKEVMQLTCKVNTEVVIKG